MKGLEGGVGVTEGGLAIADGVVGALVALDFGWEGEVPCVPTAYGLEVFPWEFLADMLEEGVELREVEVLALDPDAAGVVEGDELGEFLECLFERFVADLSREGAVFAVELDGFVAEVATEFDLEEEAGEEEELVKCGEVRTIDGEDSDLGDDGVLAAGEGLDVEDDGGGGHGGRSGEWGVGRAEWMKRG